jgi:hypothetical protein
MAIATAEAGRLREEVGSTVGGVLILSSLHGAERVSWGAGTYLRHDFFRPPRRVVLDSLNNLALGIHQEATAWRRERPSTVTSALISADRTYAGDMSRTISAAGHTGVFRERRRACCSTSKRQKNGSLFFVDHGDETAVVKSERIEGGPCDADRGIYRRRCPNRTTRR